MPGTLAFSGICLHNKTWSCVARFTEDMGLACSLDDLAAMALQWERFIKAHPGSAILDAAHKKYDSLMELMLWCDLDNTPALTRQGILKAGWLRELRAAAEKYKGTETGRIIKNYVLTIGKKDGKLDSALRKSTLGAIARVGR